MPPVGRRFARSPVVVLVVALLVVALLVVVVLLAAAAAGWFGGQHRTITGEPAPGSDEPPAVADVLGRLPALPGTAVVDGAVPTANAVPLGICSSADSEALIGAGSEQVVITSSVNGQENIAVVAIPTVDPAGTLARVRNYQRALGLTPERVYGVPPTVLVVGATLPGQLVMRGLYDSGRWTVVISVSAPTGAPSAPVGNDFAALSTRMAAVLQPD